MDYQVDEFDIEARSDLARKYHINSVPTMVMVDDDGTELSRLVGVTSPTTLIAWLNKK